MPENKPAAHSGNPLAILRSLRIAKRGGALPPFARVMPWQKVVRPDFPLQFTVDTGTSAIAAKTQTGLNLVKGVGTDKEFEQDSTSLVVKPRNGDTRLVLNGIQLAYYSKTDMTQAAWILLMAAIAEMEIVIDNHEPLKGDEREYRFPASSIAVGMGALGLVARGTAVDDRASRPEAYPWSEPYELPEAVYLGRTVKVSFQTGLTAWTPTTDVRLVVALDVDCAKVKEDEVAELAQDFEADCDGTDEKERKPLISNAGLVSLGNITAQRQGRPPFRTL